MATKRDPIVTKFSFNITGISARFAVVEFSATEYMSSPFEVDLVLTTQEEIAFEEVVNLPALLTISKANGARYFHGMIDRFAYSGKSEDGLIYQTRLVPAFWLLALKHDCRVFQEASAPEIVQTVFAEHQLTSAVEFRLQKNYPTLEFCAQYQESDFNFISRLLEEEGIFYFFEHSRTRHKLVLADNRRSCQPFKEKHSVYYTPDVDVDTAPEGIYEFQFTQSMHSGKVTLKDYNFQYPGTNLTYYAQAGEYQDFEIYHYPGRFKDHYGSTLANIRLQEEMTFKQMAVGNGSYQRFTPGKTFRLYRHEQQQFNRDYLITAVTHSGYQPSKFPRDADTSKKPGYYNDFVAIPSSVTFIPARKSPSPVINGPQTAVVTGTSGEEIYTDKYGRIKVQFHWDRIGGRDEQSSAWVRVSQIWAGDGYGVMFLPRVGQEVIVDFLHGDPSNPIIVGSLYNDSQVPPYALPESKTISTIRSSSSKGGAGSNELRFEDKSGAEEIYIHGQKDLTLVVDHDKKQSVGSNETISIGNNRTTTISNNLNESVGGQKSISVGSNSSETVAVNKQVSVGGAKSETIGAAMQLEVGAAMAVTVGAAKQVSVGGNLTETIGGNASVFVGKDLIQSIGKDLQVTVDNNLTEKVSETRKLAAGRIVITAEDEITLKSGKASIVMKKNGDIHISGKNISVKGSGNVNIKGKKITR